VIDEGCNVSHEDLAYRLPGYDALTQSDNQEPQPADGNEWDERKSKRRSRTSSS